MMEVIERHIAAHPYELLFVTISGAHLYGFPSEDSDYDVRGIHVLPLQKVVRLLPGDETVEQSILEQGVELDVVTHDVKKFFAMVLKRNGYVLEQIFSPLVVKTSATHEELKAIASQCITRHHAHHYLGFARNQWKLFSRDPRPRIKPLLYVYRVLLTGIHLMRTGQVEANLIRLNASAGFTFIDELIEQKASGTEKEELPAPDVSFHQAQYLRLVAELERAAETSSLPENPQGKEALDDLLVRIRLAAR